MTANSRELTNSPTKVSGVLALLLACVVVLTSLGNHLLGLILGIFSVILVAIGILNGSRSWLGTGTLLLVAAIVMSVFEGGTTISAIAGLGLTFVVWDNGEYAIGLGEQIGRSGVTARQELRNTGFSLAIATLGCIIGWGILISAPANVPILVTIVLATGALFLIVSLWP